MSTSLTTFRPLAVRNVLRGGLPEVGKIKIGAKGEWVRSRSGTDFQPPKKLDHFRITTLERGEDGNFLPDTKLHAIYGEHPKELPVRLLYNDPALSFQHSLVAYAGRVRWCFGDGVAAQRLDDGPGGDKKFHPRSCPCDHFNIDWTGDKKCKIAGRLSVVIDGADQVGGVWTLRTGSINTVNGIQSSLDLLAAISGGWIAGIPLLLTVQPRTAQLPGGKTSEIYVVGLEFRGSMDKLREHAERKAKGDLAYGSRMKEIERRARALTSPPGTVDEDEDGDVVAEFYPAAAAAAARQTGERVTILDEAEREDAEEEAADLHRMEQDLTRHDEPKPQGAPLVEVWDIHGQPYELPGLEVEAWLEDQLAGVASVEALNGLLAANDEHWTAYLSERAQRLRAKLLAAEEATTAPATETPAPAKKEREQRRKPKEPADVAAPAAVSAPADPAPPAVAQEGGEEDDAAKKPVTVRWPNDKEPTVYPLPAAFLAAYQRRRQFAGAGYESLFRRQGTANDTAWRQHVPASDRNPS